MPAPRRWIRCRPPSGSESSTVSSSPCREGRRRRVDQRRGEQAIRLPAAYAVPLQPKCRVDSRPSQGCSERVDEAHQGDRVRRGWNSEHTRRHAGAGVHRLVDHQIRAHPLTLFDHRRGNGLGGHVSEHGHAEVLIVQIGMASSGFLDRPVQLEVRRIPGNSRQRQPSEKRLAGGNHYLMTGIRTGQRERHHRVQVPVRAERREHDLHVAMLSDGDAARRTRLDTSHSRLRS